LAADENTEGGAEGRVIAVIGERGWKVVEDAEKVLSTTIKSGVVSLCLVGDGGLTEMRLAQMKRCAPLLVLRGELWIVSGLDTNCTAEFCWDPGMSPFSTSGGV